MVIAIERQYRILRDKYRQNQPGDLQWRPNILFHHFLLYSFFRCHQVQQRRGFPASKL